MLPPIHLRWPSIALFLQYWTLLRFGAEARPFVLLSGDKALPDDDTVPPEYQIAVGGTARAFGTKLPLLQPGYVLPALPVQEFATPLQVKTHEILSAASPARPAQPFQREKEMLVRAAMHRPTPPHSSGCRDVRQDVVIESGLQGHADVFSDGHASFAFTPESGSNFVLPFFEQAAVFVVHTGQEASLTKPRVVVSDPSILNVELSEKQGDRGMPSGADGDPVVFLSKHDCKRSGIATVTIELPLQKHGPASLCPDAAAPVVFAYQKACAPPSHTFGTFMKALTAKLPAKERLHALHRHTPEKPWAGIIPSGGARLVIGFFALFILAIVLYEFGTFWLSNKIKNMIVEMGPVMFGCECVIDHCILSMSPRRLTYTLCGLKFHNPDNMQYEKEFFMKIEEVVLEFNFTKMWKTCGRQIQIRQLIARHIKANIEVDGYLSGESNISVVMAQMEKNNNQWVADLAKIKADHGIDAAQLWDAFEKRLNRVAERVTLKEVAIEGIGCSFSNKALGTEVVIADMEFHNFTEQHNAIGMNAISYYLLHAVLEGMAEDIAGVEFGHGRFEGIINSFKSWTGAGEAPAV